MARGLASLVVDDAVGVRAYVDAVDGAVDAKIDAVAHVHHKRLGMIGHFAVPRFSEAIFKVLRTEAVRFKISEIVRDELAQDALRGGALDLAHGWIERRDVAGDLRERFIDERVDPISDGVIELRQRGRGACVIVVR